MRGPGSTLVSPSGLHDAHLFKEEVEQDSASGSFYIHCSVLWDLTPPLTPEVSLSGTILNLLNPSPSLVSLVRVRSIKKRGGNLVDTATRTHHGVPSASPAGGPSRRQEPKAAHPPLRPVEVEAGCRRRGLFTGSHRKTTLT